MKWKRLRSAPNSSRTEHAETILVGYGIVARILKAVAVQSPGVGVLRPVTLYPFPVAECQKLARQARRFVVMELSNGQLVEDVRLAVNGACPVEFYSRQGGKRALGGGDCGMSSYAVTHSKPKSSSTTGTSAKRRCSIRPTIAPDADTASYTRWWPRPLTGSASRIEPFW